MTADLDTRVVELYAPMGDVLPFRRRGGDGAVEAVRDASRRAASLLWRLGSLLVVSSSSRWFVSWTGPTPLVLITPGLRSVWTVTGGSFCDGCLMTISRYARSVSSASGRLSVRMR